MITSSLMDVEEYIVVWCILGIWTKPDWARVNRNELYQSLRPIETVAVVFVLVLVRLFLSGHQVDQARVSGIDRCLPFDRVGVAPSVKAPFRQYQSR